ncbi:MAG: rRNA (cytosine967-C5)-methyltransferase [Blastocatellia bacterium]|jgi:16S rRNA (cytosine967-C5)-methyltransferase|nr:rRNA (cytosine967-C5)-methyltransferase [Blastocatellia bacterium]
MKATPPAVNRGRAGSKGSKTVSPARRAAFEILRRVETEGAYASALLATLDQEMRQDDRALTNELVLGVLRRQLWLDRVSEHFAGRAIESVDVAVRLALRLGLYQIRFLSRIPAPAAVNESVNLVYLARLRSAASFVNAVLRRATREVEYDPAANEGDPIARIAVETSHPAWLIERWVRCYGTEAESFARANNEAAPVAFRFTRRAEEPKRILDEIRATGAVLEPSRLVADAWRVKGGSDVLQTLSHRGAIYLQDEASQLVGSLLEAKSGERVLDVCAAPGSKALHLAALDPRTMIVAADLHEHRLKTLRRLAVLQGAGDVQLVAHDAARGLPFAAGSFDRVLVDAPCTGTGTLRHNPEIRWRITESDIQELAATQRLILRNAAELVRRGGRLIYSTCSVEPEENEQVVQVFRTEHPEFAPVEPAWQKPDGTAPGLLTATGAIRTWPQRDDVDGFFMAAFTRS